MDLLFQAAGPWASWWLALAVDSAVKGSLVLVLAYVAVKVLHRSSASVRQAVWMLALGSLLAMPVLAAGLPRLRILPGWADLQTAVTEVAEAPPAPEAPDPIPPLAKNDSSHPTPSSSAEKLPPAPIPPNPARPLPPAAPSEPTHVAVTERAATHPPEAYSQSQPSAPAGPWSSRAFILWAAGVLLCLAPLVLGRLSLWRIARRARPVGGLGPAPAKQAARQLALRRRVRVLVTDRRTMPMIWGLVRPTLLLPAEADAWSGSRRWVVLLHELGHVKRMDCLGKLVARVACALYWFNPLVWLAARWMEIEVEAACDDLVLIAGARPSDYAEHLLQVVARSESPRLTAPSSISLARPSRLEGRLVRILDDRLSRRRLTRLDLIAAVSALAMVMLPLAMLRATAADKAETTEVAAMEVETVSAAPDAKIGDSPAAGVPATPSAQAEAIIAQLGAKDAGERDKAEKHLLDLARTEDVYALLRKRAADSDPEVAARIRRVIAGAGWTLSEDKKIAVRLSLEKAEVVADASIGLVFNICNDSDGPLAVLEPFYGWPWDVMTGSIEVRGPKGVIRYGGAIRSMGGLGPRCFHYVVLDPGKMLTRRYRVPAANFPDTLEEGEYRISYQYASAGGAPDKNLDSSLLVFDPALTKLDPTRGAAVWEGKIRVGPVTVRRVAGPEPGAVELDNRTRESRDRTMSMLDDSLRLQLKNLAERFPQMATANNKPLDEALKDLRQKWGSVSTWLGRGNKESKVPWKPAPIADDQTWSVMLTLRPMGGPEGGALAVAPIGRNLNLEGAWSAEAGDKRLAEALQKTLDSALASLRQLDLEVAASRDALPPEAPDYTEHALGTFAQQLGRGWTVRASRGGPYADPTRVTGLYISGSNESIRFDPPGPKGETHATFQLYLHPAAGGQPPLATRMDGSILSQVFLVVPSFVYGAEKPVAPPADARELLWKLAAPGLVPTLKFAPKDFEDLGPVTMPMASWEEWSDCGFYCIIHREGGDKPIRLRLEIKRCTSLYGAQQRVGTMVRNAFRDRPQPEPAADEPLAGLGEARFVLPNLVKGPPDPAKAINLVFCRNNVVVQLNLWDGKADLAWGAAVAAQIDKALAAAVVDPAKLPPHKPLPGLLPALPDKVLDEMGIAKAGDGGKPEDMVRDALSGTVQMRRYNSAAEAMKVFQDFAAKEPPHPWMKDDCDKIKLAGIGDTCVAIRMTDVAEPYAPTPIALVVFVRNNAVVAVRNEGRKPNTAVDLARRIDKQILSWVEAPPTKTEAAASKKPEDAAP